MRLSTIDLDSEVILPKYRVTNVYFSRHIIPSGLHIVQQVRPLRPKRRVGQPAHMEVVELAFHSLLSLHRRLLDDGAQLHDDVLVHFLSLVR